MKITAGVPIIVTLEGAREQQDRPADTETRLYWEQQLDRGDAQLMELGAEVPWDAPTIYTHRLISETGGVFHITVEGGEREWPAVGLPPNLTILRLINEEVDRMVKQIQSLMVANAELEAEVARLKSHQG